jgi:large subunit ribosomal protein L18
MATVLAQKAISRTRRKKHIRKVVRGTSLRPRLVVFRSLRQVYAQLVDDETGRTITGVSSLSPDLRDALSKKRPAEICAMVGEACARKALAINISQVVFDRNGFPYHGRVKAIAEGARKGGLKF